MIESSDLDEFERPLRPLVRAEKRIEKIERSRQRAVREKAHVELPVKRHAARKGWFVRKLQWIGRNGAPDDIFGKGGRVIFVEFKAPGKKPSPTQMREILRMREHGLEVHVIDNVERGCALFD